jgi:hypothetical protein
MAMLLSKLGVRLCAFPFADGGILESPRIPRVSSRFPHVTACIGVFQQLTPAPQKVGAGETARLGLLSL